MRRAYRSYPQPITYLQNNWQGAKLTKIAKYGTDNAFHLWNTSISRAEGAHHVLKDSIKILTGDLKTVIDRITTMLERQSTEYYAKIITNRTTYNRIYYTNRIFNKLSGWISSFAVREVYKQYKYINKEMDYYNYAFIWITGIPCIYFLYNYIINDPNWQL